MDEKEVKEVLVDLRKENCSTILITLISLLFNLLAFFSPPVTLLFDLLY
jgi:hypothetical protein